MRILVYEHITGGGLAGRPLPPSLASEGELMLQSLTDDLTRLAGIAVSALRDRRMPPLPPAVATLFADSEEPIEAQLRRAAAKVDAVNRVDAVWLIAPETDGALERLSQIVVDANRLLLGSRPAAVRIAASKFATSALLARAGVAVVPTVRDVDALAAEVLHVVIKPDDGAGCLDTRVMLREEAREWGSENQPNRVLQPWLVGDPLSLSLLCRNGEARLLSVNRQRIDIAGKDLHAKEPHAGKRHDGELHFAGVEVAAVRDVDGRYAALAADVAAALPGLWGYVGIDIIATASGPVVLEINPRLTTSYAGLSDALGCNVAELVLGLLAPRSTGDFSWSAAGREICNAG